MSNTVASALNIEFSLFPMEQDCDKQKNSTGLWVATSWPGIQQSHWRHQYRRNCEF